MKRVFLFMLCFVLWPIYLYAFDDGDFQYWNNEKVSVKLNEDYTLTLEEEFRFGDNGGHFYYQHSDIGLTYSGFLSWLDVGLNYRHIYEESSHDWKLDNQPHLNAAIKWKLFDAEFVNRGRFEYHNKEDAEDYWRYRNKFSIKSPWKITSLGIQPYIADEIFYDFNVEALNRNRLSGGFLIKITNNMKADIYYLWQASEKNDKWSDLNVLGTTLSFSF